MQQHAYILVVAIVCPLSLTYELAAQEVVVGTAASRQLQQRLQRPVTVAWEGQELGAVFKRLAETQDIEVWLDRRVDPQQTVEASFTDLSIQQVLEKLAEKHSLGVSVLDNIIYVGPVQSAHELATLVRRAQDSLAKAPSSIRHNWLDTRSTDWPRLSEPRILLTTMLEQAGVTPLASEKMAHDLWDSKQLPRMALVDKVVLILVGFDLTCQISSDGGSCQVVLIERPVVLTREYHLPRNRTKLLTELPKLIPEAHLESKGRVLTVTGRWEDQMKVQRTLVGKQTNPSVSLSTVETEKLFSLRLKNQAIGGVINQLARQLKLQIDWNSESLDKAQRSRKTLVSCDVKDVTLDELLSCVLAPAGLQFRRDGKKIEILSAP